MLEALVSPAEGDSGYQQKTVVASARTDIIKEAKEKVPDCLTSYLFRDPYLDFNSLVKGVGCDFLHPCFDVFENPLQYFTEEWVSRLRQTGAGLIAWNITSPAMAEAVVGMDIQGACADDPRIIETALSGKLEGRKRLNGLPEAADHSRDPQGRD